MVKLIETVYNFLWGDLLTVPLPGGGTLPLSLLVILLIPTGVFSVSIPMFILAILCSGGLGGGDVKLMAASGALLGIKWKYEHRNTNRKHSQKAT